MGKTLNKHVKTLLISMISGLMLNACGKSENPSHSAMSAEPLLQTLALPSGADAAGEFVDQNGTRIGHAVLAHAPNAGVLIRVDLKNLKQGWHAIHLHKIGDCTDFEEGFKISGGHINPDDREHGLLNPNGAERADLPNIYAGADGRATAALFNDALALYPSEAAAAEAGPHPLMDEDGFAIIVHAEPDDHMTQPIGGAGARVACAAITGNAGPAINSE